MWGLAAVCAMFWSLRLFVSAPMAPSYAAPVNTQQSVNGDLAKLLGREAITPTAAAAQPEAASRFKLMGVVAPKNAAMSSEEGLALMSVDGKPPRHYRVNSAVDGDIWLLSVSSRGAALGPRGGPANINISLPPPPAAAVGVLPNVLNAPGASTLPPPVPSMPPPGANAGPQQGVIDPTQVQVPGLAGERGQQTR